MNEEGGLLMMKWERFLEEMTWLLIVFLILRISSRSITTYTSHQVTVIT
jgi:hypothetical protein